MTKTRDRDLPAPKHPQDKSLSEALREDEDRKKAQKGIINVHKTLVGKGTEGTGETAPGPMAPSDEQLERINKFTRSPKTADEVVAFSTLSCNDLEDRDDDQFTTECVQDFAALEAPFSSVGKSYMVGHDYKQLAVGRIFGVDTQKVGGALFLTNEVYIPNTEANKSFIENIDFGINWAVSVGVMLGKDECSVCKNPFSSWGWWCVEGHDKGYYYDPKSDETDSFGYPIPVDPSTKGAVKCVRQFKEPRDFYELSQVFLGAQYYAELEKSAPGLTKGILKAASAGVPLIGAKAEEAKKLPLRHEPDKVSEARVRFGLTETEDGSLQWVDDQKIVWVFDPQDPDGEVMSLGKAAETETEEDEDAGREGSGDLGADAQGSDDSGAELSDEPVEDAESGDGGPGSGSDPGAEGGNEPGGESGTEPGEVAGTETDDEEKSVDKATVLAAARKAKLPNTLVDVLEKAEGTGLDALLSAASTEIESLRKEKVALTEKAALGDTYLKELRADALDWYVKAHKEGEKPVSVEMFNKVLDRCGEDVDLIKGMMEEQKSLAQAKFPGAVRRSSFETDPNQRGEAGPIEFAPENDKRVERIHG